jgi:hemerythrin-like domain-containing protein
MDLELLISNEHKTLLRLFDAQLGVCSSLESWRSFIAWCFDCFENNHHRKEEEFIFSAVRPDPRIRAGGPLCTLYFDQQMIYSSLKLAQKTVKDLTGQQLDPLWTEDLKADQVSNSPLTIPGEDHEAGRILLRGAEILIESEGQYPTLSQSASAEGAKKQEALRKLFSVYRDIQVSHFQREENCFLKMCKTLLTAERWQEISARILASYKYLG